MFKYWFLEQIQMDCLLNCGNLKRQTDIYLQNCNYSIKLNSMADAPCPVFLQLTVQANKTWPLGNLALKFKQAHRLCLSEQWGLGWLLSLPPSDSTECYCRGYWPDWGNICRFLPLAPSAKVTGVTGWRGPTKPPIYTPLFHLTEHPCKNIIGRLHVIM